VTGLLVPEGNAGLLSQALESLLSNPDLAGKLGENARNMVLAEFTWDHSTKQLVSMLKSDR
ncbi:MAG: glycosyltransferase, partial [Nitrososphaerales archaeon]